MRASLTLVPIDWLHVWWSAGAGWPPKLRRLVRTTWEVTSEPLPSSTKGGEEQQITCGVLVARIWDQSVR